VSQSNPEWPEVPVVVPWYHWIWVYPAAWVLKLWLATLRINISGLDKVSKDETYLITLWHDRLFSSAVVAKRCTNRPITALISTSKDGGWLVAFFKLMGIKAVRGSSSKRGAAALMSLTRSVRAGDCAGVTPDGPKGPRRECKVGVVALAKLTRRPFLLMGISYRRAIRLKSWDAFAIPLPFSRVDVIIEVVPVPSENQTDEQVALSIQEKLSAISGN
jgi:lysophospholipid acyltransferase (LPLAT)-like uncharacterized protein